MEGKFSFAKPFLVYVDGKELPNVSALQVTRNCNANDDVAQNKATVYYVVDGKERILTIGLEAISFGSNNA